MTSDVAKTGVFVATVPLPETSVAKAGVFVLSVPAASVAKVGVYVVESPAGQPDVQWIKS